MQFEFNKGEKNEDKKLIIKHVCARILSHDRIGIDKLLTFPVYEIFDGS